MSFLALDKQLLTSDLVTEVNYIDLWVPVALLGLIIVAAVYFYRI